MLVDERLDVPAHRRHEAEVVEDHRAQLEDEAAQLLERLVHHLPERGKLGTRALRVDFEETLADLRLEHHVRHGLGRSVVHLARDALALLLLRVHDGLKEAALVDDGRGVGGERRLRVRVHVVLRGGDERPRAIEELLFRLQPGELGLHRHPPRKRGVVIVGGREDLLTLEVARIGAHFLDACAGLILARFEPAHFGQRRLDEEIQLADLRGDLLLFGDELAREVGGHRAQLPISGPLIHPCRIAYTTACVRSFTDSLRRMLDM